MARIGAHAKGLLIYLPECPYCRQGRIERTRLSGFWERRIFTFFRIWPVRCMDCRSRFYRFVPEAEGPVGTPEQARNLNRWTVTPPGRESGADDFEELVDAIAQDEKERFGPSEGDPRAPNRRSGARGRG